MARPLDQVASDFDSLTAADFDEWNRRATGPERLRELCDELKRLGDPLMAAAVLFRTMERLDGSELGTPGPLVHTLEAWGGQYEAFLVESVSRKPTPLSVWMVNRILNGNAPNREAWLSLLRRAEHHPAASDVTRAQARDFLQFQTRRT